MAETVSFPGEVPLIFAVEEASVLKKKRIKANIHSRFLFSVSKQRKRSLCETLFALKIYNKTFDVKTGACLLRA